ncbi:MAG: hypothetical protein S4CHLAM102_07160 [Chlamydiia bacterium]|nr:hypothetical protein [Chlamydiia bacterium]
MTPKEKFIRILLPFMAGFFLVSIFRAENGVLAPFIAQSLNIHSGNMGVIVGMYFLAFGLSQIPLGVLLDHLGPRITQSLFFLIATVAAFWYAFSPNEWQLIVSRLVIGIGLSGGLMAGLVANRLFYPKEHLPFYNGVISVVGNSGAIVATAPLHFLAVWIGWRGASVLLAVLTLGMAIWFYLAVPTKEHKGEYVSFGGLIKRVGRVFKTSFYWHKGMLPALTLATLASLQALWTTYWLKTVDGLSPTAITIVLLFLAIGIVLGTAFSALVGTWSICGCSLLHPALYVGAVGAIIAQILIGIDLFPGSALLWGVYGFFGGTSMLGYTCFASHFSPRIAGIAITALNVAVFLFAFLIICLFGLVVHLFGHLVSGGDSPTGYFVALWILIILQILAFIYYFLPMKETPHELKDSR